MSDMLERAGWTFVEAFLGVFVLSDLGSVEAAAIAGGAAALAVVKTYAKDKLAADGEA